MLGHRWSKLPPELGRRGGARFGRGFGGVPRFHARRHRRQLLDDQNFRQCILAQQVAKFELFVRFLADADKHQMIRRDPLGTPQQTSQAINRLIAPELQLRLHPGNSLDDEPKRRIWLSCATAAAAATAAEGQLIRRRWAPHREAAPFARRRRWDGGSRRRRGVQPKVSGWFLLSLGKQGNDLVRHGERLGALRQPLRDPAEHRREREGGNPICGRGRGN